MTTTIHDVKWMVELMSGIPIEQSRLIYRGLSLADDRSMSDYNIFRGANLVLVLALRGD